MKKLNSILLLVSLTIVFFVFNGEVPFVQNQNTENSIKQTGGDDPTNDPNYASNKLSFYNAYQVYQSSLTRGIVTQKPIDPSGMFHIDEHGNMDINHHNELTNNIAPPNYTPDVVSGYTFTQPGGTYTSIVGGVGTVFVISAFDDQSFGALPIGGFTFTYDGIGYTQFGLNCNGFISMGATAPITSYTSISTGTTNNVIAGFNADLYGLAAGNGIYYQTSGVSPNRVLTVQWTNTGFFASGNNEISFQIKLFETSNNIQIIYGPGTHITTSSLQVGMRGASNADFNNRTTSTNWATTTAGGVNSASCTHTSTIFPAANLTFQWAPPVATPMTYVSSTTAQYQNGVPALQNSTNQIINQIQVVTSGSTSPFTVTNFNLGTNGSTAPGTDITNCKVYYTGTSNIFATTTLVGTTVSPNGTFNLAAGQVLSTGTNYFWVTYDVPLTATYLDLLDGQCNTITGTGTMGTVVPTITTPAGTRFVEKSTLGYGGYSNNGNIFGLWISNVTFGTINNTSVFDPNGNWYTATYPYNLAYANYFATVPSVSQGSTYPISITEGNTGNANGMAVWFDWNQNGSFSDAGEYYNLGVIPGSGPATLAGNITVPLGATLGNTRMRVRSNFSSAPAAGDWNNTALLYGETEDYMVTVTAATNMVYVSSTCTQNVLTAFFTPSLNTQILGIQIVTNGVLSPLSATSFTLNTNGSTNAATDITNAKLWYTGTSNAFATTTQVGGTFNAPNGSFTINGSQVLSGGTNYFWLTYDVPVSATNGDVVDAECNSLTVGSPFTPTVTAPAGNRLIGGSALCGTYTIPGSYATIAAAIADLNLKGVSCPVVFNVAAGYTETAANLVINTTGTSANTIKFQKSGAGANPLITAAAGVNTFNDAVIKFNGVSYITFDGIDLQESGSNVTTTTQMEWGYAFLKVSGTQGCSNNTIKNCGITLNKTNLATIGIYSSNLSTANVTQTVTNISGANSNNTFQNVSVSNSYVGLNFTGYADASPYSFYDQNNTVTGCSVTNFGGSFNIVYGLYNYYQNGLNISGNTINGGTGSTSTLYGIYVGVINNSNLTISNNTVTLICTGGSTNIVYGINFGAGSVGTTNNISITNNTVQNCNFTSATSGSMYHIYCNATTSNLTVSGNKVIGNTYGTAGSSSGTVYYIYNANSAVNNISITNNLDSANVVNGTSAYVLYYIYNGVSANTATVTGNKVSNNQVCGTTASVTTYGIYNGAGTFTCTMNNNNVSSNNLPSTSLQSMYCMYNFSPAPTSDYSSNTVAGNTSNGPGTLYGIYFSGAPGLGSTVNINNNNVNNLQKLTATGTGSIYGIYQIGSGQGTININTNTINNNSSAAATTIYGIYQNGSPPNNLNINNNTVNNISNNGLATIYGIYNFPTSSTITSISGNTFSNITSLGGTIYGLYTTSGTTVTLNKNNIFGITSNTSTTAIVYGMFIAGGTTVYASNNYISDINAPASTSTAPAVTGLNISGGTNIYAYYNSILLKATSSSATSFGTAGIYASTGPNVELKNNVVIDLSTPGPTGGNACAYRRSTTLLTTYTNASNNNCFYAGAPGLNHVLYYDGTNSDQTLAAYKTRVSPRDQVTVSENPPFVNAASTPYNLHIQTTIPTSLESGGQIISSPISIVDDWDGQARYPNAGYPVGGFTPVAPDIGADEFGGLYLDNVPPSISYSPLGPSGTANRSFPNVTITDGSGVNTTVGTRPRCYYKKSTEGNVFNDNTPFTDGWKYSESNGTTTPFDFTIDYSRLFTGSPVAGDVIQYFVIAQDLAGTPNVGWNQATFTGGPPTSVNLYGAVTGASGMLTYTITANVFSGGYDVGTGWTYPTLTGAGGLFQAINSGAIAGNVTAFIHTDITEPGTFALNKPSETGPGGYTITIVPFDATLKTISGSFAGGMITFNGPTRIIIDGNGGFADNPSDKNSSVNDNSGKLDKVIKDNKNTPVIKGKDTPGGTKYLLFRNTNGANPTFLFQNDAIRNTITNCYIESNNTNTASGTISFASTTLSQGNDSNTISYCDIRDRGDFPGTPANGIWSSGNAFGTLAQYNNYNTITNCNIYNNFTDVASSQAGIYLNGGSSDWAITNNSVYQTAARVFANAATCVGIYNNSSLDNDIIVTGNFIGGSATQRGGTALTFTGAGAYTFDGIYLFVGGLAASSIQNNTIQNINLATTAASFSDFFRGIKCTNSTGLVNIGNITGNFVGDNTTTGNIVLTNNTSTITYTLALLEHAGWGDVSNNILGSVTLGGTATLVNFRCIQRTVGFTGSTTINIVNNICGSNTIANSIFQVADAVRGTSSRGISVTVNSPQTLNCTNNIVANWNFGNTNSGVSTTINGIQSLGTGFHNITGNVVHDISSATGYAAFTNMLCGFQPAGTSILTFSQNTTYNLNLTNTGAFSSFMEGVLCTGGAIGSVISKNTVYNLQNQQTGASPTIVGIGFFNAVTVNADVTNNMISLTNGEPTDVKYPNLPFANFDVKNNSVSIDHKNSGIQTVTDRDFLNAQRIEKRATDNQKETYSNGDLVNDPTLRDNKSDNKTNNPTLRDNNTNNKGDVFTNGMVIQGFEIYNSGFLNFYYNSVYVGGTATAGANNSADFFRFTGTGGVILKNNLFVNARTGGTGKNYVVSNQTGANGWSASASNYNVFLGSNAATIGEWPAGTDNTIAQWRTTSGGENQTWSTTTGTINPSNLFTSLGTGNLNINSGNFEAWLVKGKGIALTGQNTDFAGNTRSTTITGGCTSVGANEVSAVPPANPTAVESAPPAGGTTTTYTLWGRTLASIDWLTGATSYPTGINVNYYSGVNPANTVGGNFSNSNTFIVPSGGTLTNGGYNITYYFGDNETGTIASPATNTVLAKYNTTWEVFPSGTGNYLSQLTYNTASEIYTVKVPGLYNFSDFALTDNNSPLPVTMSSFTITPAGRDANAKWVTTSELNNKGFYLERRFRTGINNYSGWQSVSFINGHGNSNTSITYNYTDKKLSVGNYQFRLKQVDFNGNITLYNSNNTSDIAIGKPINSDMSQNYPNPSNPKSKIDYQIPFDGKVSIKVYDLTGREITTLVDKTQQAGYYTTEFDGTNLASGIYFYRIISEGDNQKFTKTLKMVLVK